MFFLNVEHFCPMFQLTVFPPPGCVYKTKPFPLGLKRQRSLQQTFTTVKLYLRSFFRYLHCTAMVSQIFIEQFKTTFLC